MVTKRLSDLLKDSKGSTIVEVAIVLPVIFFLIFAFIYFIELSRVSTVMELAANEASREMAISKDHSISMNKAYDVLDAGHLTLIGDGSYNVRLQGGQIAVERSVSSIPFMSNIFTMTKTANYRSEDDTLYYNKGSAGLGYTGNPY